jgi:hypothetical protein
MLVAARIRGSRPRIPKAASPEALPCKDKADAGALDSSPSPSASVNPSADHHKNPDGPRCVNTKAVSEVVDIVSSMLHDVLPFLVCFTRGGACGRSLNRARLPARTGKQTPPRAEAQVDSVAPVG